MKKWHWMSAAGVAALGVATMAYAASISNLSGQSCGDFTGNWHFVNNQTGGGTGTLDVCFSSGCYYGCSAVQGERPPTCTFNCQRQWRPAVGRHHIPGRLVLSDFSCTTTEPPKCDPARPTPAPCDPPK